MNQEYEYIATLSPDEKKAFLDCFCCMICADKQVAKEEIEFLKNIGIVKCSRFGKVIFYSLKNDTVNDVLLKGVEILGY